MRILILIVFLGLSQGLFSQNDSTATKGEIIDGEIVIEKEKKITLPKAEKVFKKTELKSFNSDALNLTFEVFQPTFDWPRYKSDVPYQSINKKYPSPNFQSFAKLGFGNYSSPLVEIGVFKQVGQLKLSSGLFHESFGSGSVNGEFSGSSYSKFNLAANYSKDGLSLIPYIKVSNQQYNFYGNTDRLNTGFSSEEPDEVRYNQVAFGTRLIGSSNGINYYANAEVANSTQRLEDGVLLNKEPYLKGMGGISIKIDTSFKAGFDLEGYSSSYESGISYDRSLITLTPWVRYQKNDKLIKAGFTVASSETLNEKVSGFYPYINGDIKLGPNWGVYAFVTGGMDWNNLNQLISENQFIDDSLLISNIETKLKVGGGIKGTLLKGLNINAGVSYSSVNGLPFYVPSTSDSARFILTYDTESIEILSLEIGASYAPNSISKYGAEIEIKGYSLNDLNEPWHLPNFQLKLYSVYNINQKVIFSTSLISLAGLQSPSSLAFGREELDPIIDLNIGVKYLITNRASVFVDASNLLNKEYERYIGYPVRGLAFKIGGKYRF